MDPGVKQVPLVLIVREKKRRKHHFINFMHLKCFSGFSFIRNDQTQVIEGQVVRNKTVIELNDQKL